MAEHIKVLGDVITYHGEPVARIIVGTGVVRDRFETGILEESNIEVQKHMKNDFMAEARRQAKDKADTLTIVEIDDIFDKLLEA